MTTTILTHDEQISEDRQLLAAVGRWSRRTGWHPTRVVPGGWRSADERTMVRPVAEGVLEVWRGIGEDEQPGTPDRYPVRSVTEAVDVLAAIGVLPLELSSGWRAGAAASEVTPEPDITRVWGANGYRWDRDRTDLDIWVRDDGLERHEWWDLVLEEGPVSTVPAVLIGGEPS